MPENQPEKGGWRRDMRYAAAFIGGAALATGTIYFGQQTSREPIPIVMNLDSDQIPDLLVRDYIFNNPPGIKWGERDNVYLGQPGGGFKPLRLVDKDEIINTEKSQEARRKEIAEKIKNYVK